MKLILQEYWRLSKEAAIEAFEIYWNIIKNKWFWVGVFVIACCITLYKNQLLE